MAPPDDYGWAYIDAQRTTASADGPSGSLQFRWGSEDLIPGQFSGSEDLVFYANSVGHLAWDGTNHGTGSQLYLYGDLFVTGAIYADSYTVRSITTTEVEVSGSTTFGDSSGDTHQRTGSLEVSGPSTFSDTVYISNKLAHKGDGEDAHSDTYMGFWTDAIQLRAGSTNMVYIYGSDSSASQNYIGLNASAGTNDTDFYMKDGTGAGTYQFYVRGSDSTVATPGSMHISAALGPVTGSGEIHASRLVSNDIFTSGSIGIGTSDPLAEPNEKNDLVIGDHTGNRGMSIASANTGVGTIRFSPYTSANNGEGWIDYSGNTNKMRFGTNGLNTRMTIGAAGNVGIGVGDPDSHLEVLGTSNQFKLSYDASKYTTFNTDATGFLTITPSAGRTNLVNSSYLNLDTPLVHIGENDTSDVKLNFRGSTNDLPIDYDESAKKLAFDTSDLVIDAANARVGIATASPAMTLDVNGTDGDGGVNITGSLDVTADAVIQGTLWAASTIAHIGDSDTKMIFSTDTYELRVGNKRMISATEDDTQDNVTINTSNADIDFIVAGDTSAKVFHVQAAAEASGPPEMVHISGTLGPVSGSGEIHATGFTGNDAILSASLTIGTANAVGSQVPLTINRSGSTQAVVIAGGMTASHAVHVEHLYTNDLYVSGTAYGITVDRANYASASDTGTTRTYSPSGFDTSGYLYVSGSTILGSSASCDVMVTGSLEVSGPSHFTSEVHAEGAVNVDGLLTVAGASAGPRTVLGSLAEDTHQVTGSFEVSGPANFTNIVGAEAGISSAVLLQHTGHTVLGDSSSDTARVSGSFEVAGNVVLSSQLFVTGSTHMADNLDVTGSVGVVGALSTYGDFRATDNTQIGASNSNTHQVSGTVHVSSTMDVSGAVGVMTDLRVWGHSTFGKAAGYSHQFTGSLDLANNINVTGTINAAGTIKSYDTLEVAAGTFVMPDNTSAKILVADGNSYQEVAVSNHITIASNGAVTIANDAVDTNQIADDAIEAAQIADGAIGNVAVDNASLRADKLDITNSTDIGEALADDDVMVIGNTSASGNRKSAMSRVKTYTKTDIGSVGTAEANKAIIVDNNVAINSGLTSVTGSKDLYFKDVKATSNLISDGGLLVSGSSTLAAGLTSSYGVSIPDHEKLRLGSSDDLKISHNATNTLFVNQTGHMRFDNQATGKHIQMDLGADDATTQFQVRNNAGTELFSIDTVGTAVTGTLEVSSTTNLQATNLFGATSGSSTLAIQGSASFGAPVDISGDLVFHAAATAGRIDIKVNDGAGADTAIQIGKNGIVTKIGDDTPSDGQYLSWDNTAGKVAWADGLTSWGMSGSDNHYSSTELRTSGDLKVSGSITFGAGATLSGSAAGPSSYLVLDANNQIKMASPFYNTDNSEILFGADEEVRLIHSPDDGLIIKRTATGDNNPPALTLQSGETVIGNTDVIGLLQWQAPDEAQGGDGALVCASIVAIATDTFDATTNSTKLSFKTATDGAAVRHIDLEADGKLQGYNGNAATWDITADGTGSFQQIVVADQIVHASDTDTGIHFTNNTVEIHAQTNSQPQITVTQTEVVINEESNSLDFRVESNSHADMLFVDGGNNKVTIAGSGASALEIGGGAGSTGITMSATGSINMDGHVCADEFHGTFKGDLAAGIACGGDIYMAGALKHVGDVDTKIAFTTDQMDFTAGNVNFLRFDEATQDLIRFNNANADIDFQVSTSQSSGSLLIDGDTGDVHICGDTFNFDHSEGTLLIRPSNSDQGTLILASRDSDSSDDAQLDFRRYTDGSFADGDNLGIIQFKGSEDEDGTYYSAAGIMAEVDEGAWVDGTSTAGRLKFFTTADGAASLSTALLLDSSQNMTTYGTATIGGDIQINGNDVKDSGGNTVLSFDGSGNIDNDVTIQSGTANMKLVSTAGMSALDLYGDGTSMADGDNIGAIRFYGTEDSGTGNSVQVGYMVCEVADAGFNYASSAGAMIKFGVMVDGGASQADEVLYINGNTTEARVGIGVEAPEKMLHVYGANNSTGYVALIENGTNNDSADGLAIKIAGDTSPEGGNSFLKFLGGATTVGYVVGDGSGGVTYTEPFTGKHPTVTADASNSLLVGLIMSSTGEIWVRNTETVSTGLPKTTMANTDNDKGVFGIISDTPTFDPNVNEGGLDGEWSIYDGYFKFNGVGEDESALVVNSMGEGLVWVTNKNGEVEQGDYICSTVVPGHGGKQADDLLHNYTVAKCVETIDWDSVTDTIDYNGITYKKYLTACTYNCG